MGRLSLFLVAAFEPIQHFDAFQMTAAVILQVKILYIEPLIFFSSSHLIFTILFFQI